MEGSQWPINGSAYAAGHQHASSQNRREFSNLMLLLGMQLFPNLDQELVILQKYKSHGQIKETEKTKDTASFHPLILYAIPAFLNSLPL